MMPIKMPVLFIGHGSPMNAIEENAFTAMLEHLGNELPLPQAILCISAHWITSGSWLTSMPVSRTIHDFYGFPQPLFEVQYPAPGSPALAQKIKEQIKQPHIHLDENWGLDHGSWSILRHMYPQANIPVIQLSIDMSEPPEYHFNLGQQLKELRTEGVLIIGSGNIVHNLSMIRWSKHAKAYPWACEFDKQVKEYLLKRDFAPLMNELPFTASGRLSVPTLDHYLPLIYVLGCSDINDQLTFIFEEIELGSISMRSLKFH
ncbi:4,5-DOPA-extradiol-dioxygenase [Legionella fallonii]|uniref:Putative enzyme n=1 Tax=Legionella fallonii LLAP-10 TaxID=1212491 RepID=A0A098GA45_9GAMM|nr:4,5-DOPA dioxygenase extradiol [Legionella fallonii]CEG58857.1 putative enzyme [Legionella fallonii LLAP-10]